MYPVRTLESNPDLRGDTPSNISLSHGLALQIIGQIDLGMCIIKGDSTGTQPASRWTSFVLEGHLYTNK
jgi:hypothetical protein